MKIAGIAITDLKFSRVPVTLERNLCTPTSKFRDALARDVADHLHHE
jgi:hypothetical protein